jgi:hypothetical protein
MRRIRRILLAALVTLAPQAAASQDLSLPTRPEPRPIMRALALPRGFIAMFNTTVVRDNSGKYEVLYGFIFGNMQRDGIIYVANDVEGIVCQGKTTRQPDRSGLGEMTCSRNGTVYAVSPVEIAPGVYGKFNGIDSGVVLDPKGRQIGSVVSQWNAWDFPDAAEIVARWK